MRRLAKVLHDTLAEWAGKSATVFKDEFSGVPKNLKKLEKSHGMCGDALADFPAPGPAGRSPALTAGLAGCGGVGKLALLLVLLAAQVDRVGGRVRSLRSSMARRRVPALRVIAASRSRFSGVRIHVAGSIVRPSRYFCGIAACWWAWTAEARCAGVRRPVAPG